MHSHKYDMGIIGNCSYLAYVDTKADIKWMCMPRFDSSFIFGSLLDEEKGGHFYVQPSADTYENVQYYIENTNVLCTEFATSDGRFKVVDCAPRMTIHDRQYRPTMLIRKIELMSGSPVVKVGCSPKGDYGRINPEVVIGSNHIRYLNLTSQVRLTTDIPITYVLNESFFVLDQDRYLVFTYGEPLEAPLEETAEEFLRKTIHYWQGWVKTCYLPNIYQEQVIRSALVLKLHQYEDTGGIIASGTTSLPEYHESSRNWDYRYCWFRDAYYTLRAFNQLGHFEELEKYFEFIQNILNNSGDNLQPLYSISGEKELYEIELDYLSGYKGNKPVRIGNKAYEQVQYDVYGQVLVGVMPLYTDRRLTFTKKSSYKKIVSWLLKQIERTRNLEDAGLWEFRNQKQIHTYTLLFHWAGAKAAYKIAKQFQDEVMMQQAERLSLDAADMLEKCYNPQLKAYTQAMNTHHMDASTLMMITMNYLEHNSQKARDHIAALEKDLLTDRALFYRYKHFDDFGVPESTFLVCAFWYVDSLACVGRVKDAIENLNKLLHYSNHLGIFSEDVANDGSQWGNFPQTYSHVGLINAAFRIWKRMETDDFI